MSFGLARGRTLDAGGIGITDAELPPLPDRANNATIEATRVDPRPWFPNPDLPLEIEIGSGKGTFLVQQCELQPDANFLGIEWAKEFYAYAADRLRRRAATNVRMLHGDATAFVHWRVPTGIVRTIHLYFSDPWPKKRHHKRRVVQDSFLADIHRILIPGGELRIVTDHDDYWAWMEEHFARWTAPGTNPLGLTPAPFERLAFERPASAGAGETVGTNFERKYAREGRPFHATTLRKPG